VFKNSSVVALCLLTALTALGAACGSSPAGNESTDPVNVNDGGNGSGGGVDIGLPDSTSGTDAGDDSTVEPDVEISTDVPVENDSETPDVAPPEDTTVTPDVEPEPDVAPDATPDTTLPEGPVDPYVDGIYEFTTREVEVPDSSGGERDAVLYIPSSDEVTTFPFVVLSHGFQLRGSFYSGYAERLASHGIIVLLPTWGDSLIASRAHLDLANDVETMIGWAIQQNGAGGAFEGQMDITSIGVAGHSRGGKQSILAAINDDRIRAVFGLDPVDTVPPIPFIDRTTNPSVTPELMDGLTVPFAAVGAGLGGTASSFISPACAPATDNYQAYYDQVGAPAYLYVIPDAGHNQFLFSCSGAGCGLCTSGDDGEFMRDLSNALMTSFFRFYLADDTRYQPFLSGESLEAFIADGKLQFRSR